MPRPLRLILLLAGLLCTGLLAGCGLQPRQGTGGVRIIISTGFGTHVLRTIEVPSSSQTLTPLALLTREAKVTVGSGARVLSIDGVRAGPGEYWSHFINGIGQPDLTATQAAERIPPPDVHKGDDVWWDIHPSAGARFIPAVVGAYPEPFRLGIYGKRFPTTLECASDADVICRSVSASLAAAGIPAATQEIGTGSGQDTIGVLVGTWRELRGTLLATLLDAGPSASGVYARFTAGGGALELLNGSGAAVRTEGAGAGLLAAVRDNADAPTWVITGTDLRGVAAAAKALTAAALHGRYAVAAVGGSVLPLPLG